MQTVKTSELPPKFTTYQKPHCYQYDIRLRNSEKDRLHAGLTLEEVNSLRVNDFEFGFVPKEDKRVCRQVKEFIEEHEWLGKMPHRPTHRFTATYKGKLAGVIVMATPNSFSNLLGPENQHLEKLIARGACISWSPKNLASALIMFSIRWMVKNTPFRFFTAYSDKEARELGTIYQACNFLYLGTTFGARAEFLNPKQSQRGWFSDRLFRKPAQYLNYAASLGIKWQTEWGSRKRINWGVIPELTQARLKKEAKLAEASCKRRDVPKKLKYVYLLGKTRNETKRLHLLFRQCNPEKVGLNYPKDRGPQPAVVKENSPQVLKIAA